MNDYEVERERIVGVRDLLRAVEGTMEPAWSGLANHPDMEELDRKLTAIRMDIRRAASNCQRLSRELNRKVIDDD
jgi:hypothetical protein